ncbi:hypothetical protein BNJ_00321 [Kaumoebavirus]|uniref:hypothetical protein n=1 Tax=Kaumoebavirus TaxID=1859492 RepID=UPI0009C381DC|nr:hypothetical protein BNJ_00321 [Kaumoebavirus]ARA72143.1 hypothetical protein BNJ_00321 [Kaumoebavirus]
MLVVRFYRDGVTHILCRGTTYRGDAFVGWALEGFDNFEIVSCSPNYLVIKAGRGIQMQLRAVNN